MLNQLVDLPRVYKKSIFVFVDLLSVPIVFWLSFNLRLDFNYGIPSTLEVASIILTTLGTVFVFVRLGLYRAMLRHVGLELAWVIAKGAVLSALLMTVFSLALGNFLPRSVPFIYFLMLLVVAGGVRFFVRHAIHRLKDSGARHVAIYGAGAAGAQVFSALSGSKEYVPVLFIDDDRILQGRTLRGIPIVSGDQLPALVSRYSITDVLLAVPSASHSRRRAILDLISPLPVHVRTIPGIDELVEGKAKIEEFKEVDIDDLLGRDAVEPDRALLQSNILNKVVMVTGAGGSIGSELCRQISTLQPKALVLFEQCEYALYKIHMELIDSIKTLGCSVELYPVLGSVQNEKKLESTVSSLSVNTMYHAAAYKHVPLVEYNLVEGIRNNVFGTLSVVNVADRCGVESCVLISTDKAVRPTNVMGASKRMAELILQAKQKGKTRTTFSMVRFGNVLGSSGSVIPLFREQVSKGGPVTVTHPDIIRYFMTIPEAAQLVIQAGAMAEGGDVFVLEMGEPVRIADLARKMIRLMGLSVKEAGGDGDVEITFTGLRPGEKLYEELLIGENVTPTQHPRIMRAMEFSLGWVELSKLLDELDTLCADELCAEVVDWLKTSCPLDFNPMGELSDILWNRAITKGSERVPEKKQADILTLNHPKEMAS